MARQRERKVYQGRIVSQRRYAAGWHVVTVECGGLYVTVHFDPTKAELNESMSNHPTYHAVEDVYGSRGPRRVKKEGLA